MNVLVVNAGSSSLKYQLFDTTAGVVRAKGLCERIGIDGKIKHQNLETGAVYEKEIAMPNHTVATKIVIDALLSAEYGSVKSMDEIEAVGHRIVHGGAYFSESVLLTDEVLAKLELCRDLAPLHTGAHIMGIQGCLAAMPNTPQVLVFDTAFHTATMPDYAYVYPVSYDMYEKYAVRRYGAHGTSHRYVSHRVAELMGKDIKDLKLITCHIGNGSSITAIKNGKVIDTSMGLTPLDGFMMGTRTGTLDPSVVTFIAEKENLTPAQLSDLFNKKSGLLGISGISSDDRDICKAEDEGDERAHLAHEMLVYQIQKFIGSYVAALNGVDAIVFTAGLGENQDTLRERICTNMEYLGIKFDHEANKGVRGKEKKISAPDSKVAVYIVPTNEELVIARDTKAIVEKL